MKNDVAVIANQHKSSFEAPDVKELIEVLSCIIRQAYEQTAPHSGRAGLSKDIATLNRRVEFEGLSFLTERLPSLGKSFLAYVETGSDGFSGFKTRNGLPVFLGGLFRCYERDYYKVEAFRAIYQITSLCKKLRGDYDKRLQAENWNTFCSVDTDLASVDAIVLAENDQTLKLARYFCAQDFGHVDPETDEGFIGRPGPGAVEDKCPRPLRYEPQRLYRQHDDVMDYRFWFYPIVTDVNHRARHYLHIYATATDSPIARYVCVPKTAGKPRGICIERNESQFLQQTIAAGILYVISNGRLYESIKIDNQAYNAMLALKSSIDGEDATLDMTDGSDRISRLLASYVFRDCPLHDYLVALSTRVIVADESLHKDILDSGGTVILETLKYAPMGSGLCFPIMSLIHYYLIRAILVRCCGMTSKESRCISVYGDDIVIPSSAAETVFSELPKYGMKLNRTKSFFRSKFRESCGIHAFNGVDVTPVYMKYTSNSTRPGHIHSVAVNEKHLRKRGWIEAAEVLEGNLRSKGLKNVPEESGLFGIQRPFSDCGYPRKIRYNFDLQCWEGKMARLSSRTASRNVNTQTGALMRYWGQHTECSMKVEENVSDETFIRYSWTPMWITGVNTA